MLWLFLSRPQDVGSERYYSKWLAGESSISISSSSNPRKGRQPRKPSKTFSVLAQERAERADTKQRATLTNSKQQATTSRPIAKPASQSASHLLAEEETDKKAGSGSGSTGSSNCPTDCSFGLWDEP